MSALALIACAAVAAVGSAGSRTATRQGLPILAAFFWCLFVIGAAWGLYFLADTAAAELEAL